MASDFAQMAKSPFFVDKTLFIKDFITTGYTAELKIMTAPTKCGKSTIMDMVKRFLSIPLDINGNRIPVNTTENYKLFCSKPLEVCKDKAFVAKHLGQHPTLHVDYTPLGRMTSYQSFMEIYQSIIQSTYKEHGYLLVNPNMTWKSASEKARFMKHYDDKQFRTLNIYDIIDAFKFLTKLMCRYYNGKEVMLLLDEYDVQYRTVLFSNVTDWDPILIYMEAIFRSFLVYNLDMNRGLLTGVLRMYETDTEPDDYIHDYRWLGGHIFTKYFGLNEEEITELIIKNVKDVTQHNETMDTIQRFYDGYIVMDLNTKLYSIWSVVKYFENNLIGRRYWVEVSYFHKLIPVLFDKSRSMREEVKWHIITGSKLEADILEPLYDVDIEAMKEMLETDVKLDRPMFFYLMFELGLLSTEEGAANDTDTFSLLPPTYEIQIEFVYLLRNYETDTSESAQDLDLEKLLS